MKFVVLAVLIGLVAGCKYDLPDVDNGSFELFQNGGIKKGELAKFQVTALTDWLRAHQSGWEYKIQDRPPALNIFLKRKEATLATVYIGKHSVAVGELVRPISPEERATLVSILAGFLTDETAATSSTQRQL
jgi:hypothetical protein